MLMPFIQLNYLKYYKGKGLISGHVEALHAAPPAADQFTDKIVENCIQKTECAGIISTISRTECDLNRSPNGANDKGIEEYRKTIKDILEFLHLLDPVQAHVTRPYLHLSFHGMKDIHYGAYAIEVGSLRGLSCSPEVKQWMMDLLAIKAKEISSEIKVIFDQKFIGDESVMFHRQGDMKSYTGYGEHFHTFQIEISRTLRKKYPSKIGHLFAQMMCEFQTKFVGIDL